MTTQIQLEPETKFNEIRWTIGAWLTLAVALVWPLWSLGLTLANSSFPTDGWLSTFPNYVLTVYLLDEPSPLQSGDRILAINDQPVGFSRQTPLILSGLQEGQHLQYTIQRNDQILKLDIVLKRSPLSALFTFLRNDLIMSGLGSWVSLFSLGVAVFVFLRRPDSPAARYMLLIFSFVSFGISEGYSALYAYSYPPPWSFLAVLQTVMIFVYFFPTCILFLLTFPVQKWPLQRFPRALPLVLYGLPMVMIVPDIWHQVTGQTYGDGSWINVIPPLTVGGFVFTLLATQIHNGFIVRNPVERAQYRWVAFGLGVGWGIGLMFGLLSGLEGETEGAIGLSVVAFVLQSLFPLSLAIAILRYRLFDIDIIIRRTLQYSLLTSLLALTYFGSIVLLQNTFFGNPQSEIATVLSTLAIAALFTPLRRRVQDFIDRRFYRKKYNAERALAQFAETARDEVDMDKLAVALIGVVHETMQPERVSLWLKRTKK